MQEKEIQITGVNPIEIFGPKEGNLKLLKKKFRKLKLIARGEMIKVIGSQSEIESFEKKLNLLIAHYHKYNRLSESNVDNLLRENGADYLNSEGADAVLVYGNSGIKVKARTANQRKLVAASDKHDLTFAIGPAGTGKTYTAVALAVRALKNKEIKRIILTRPAVEAGENLGFLPGDMKEKVDPYMQPLYDALNDFLPGKVVSKMYEKGSIEIAPLAFMRGRTLKDSFIVLDEGQNTSPSQMKMFLTRLGIGSRMVVTGDITQIDLPRGVRSGLVEAPEVLSKMNEIDFIKFNDVDIVRHSLVRKIAKAYEKKSKQSHNSEK